MSGEFGNASPNPLSLNAPSTSAPVERAPIKTKITLRPPAQPPTPFYTMKSKLPQPSELLGSMDLLSVYDLSNSYNKFCSPQGMKRIAKEDLSSFLPHLYGEFNWQRGQEISWLKMLIEKPPITGKEIVPLNSSAMASFKLQPGIVDEPYRSLFDTGYEVKDGGQKEMKKEKRKLKMSIDPLEEDCIDNWAMDGNAPDMGSDEEGGTKKKKKKSDKDREERKERKKEKKEKKEKKKKEKEHN